MSPWHWALVIAVGILLFGAKRLPDAARSLGRSARILKAELGAEEPAAPGATSADGPVDPAPPRQDPAQTTGTSDTGRDRTRPA